MSQKLILQIEFIGWLNSGKLPHCKAQIKKKKKKTGAGRKLAGKKN
jgi:hypothetical protein